MPKKQLFDTLLDVIGIFSILGIVYAALKELNHEVKTDVISNTAVKAIKNPDENRKLKMAMDEYHKTGSWPEEYMQNLSA